MITVTLVQYLWNLDCKSTLFRDSESWWTLNTIECDGYICEKSTLVLFLNHWSPVLICEAKSHSGARGWPVFCIENCNFHIKSRLMPQFAPCAHWVGILIGSWGKWRGFWSRVYGIARRLSCGTWRPITFDALSMPLIPPRIVYSDVSSTIIVYFLPRVRLITFLQPATCNCKSPGLFQRRCCLS